MCIQSQPPAHVASAFPKHHLLVPVSQGKQLSLGMPGTCHYLLAVCNVSGWEGWGGRGEWHVGVWICRYVWWSYPGSSVSLSLAVADLGLLAGGI